MHSSSSRAIAHSVEKTRTPNTASSDRTIFAKQLCAASLDPRGTLVETYLHMARGIYLPPAVVGGGHVLYHAQCPFTFCSENAKRSTVRLPAMIAKYTDPVSGAFRAILRTALRADGSGKAAMPDGGDAKRALGPSKGAVIRLSPDEQVTTGLAIAEGVENGLAVLCAGWSPVWAAGSAANLESLPVLNAIESLTIFADIGKAGEEAADACARRWASAGREVIVKFPRYGDWNDVVRSVNNG